MTKPPRLAWWHRPGRAEALPRMHHRVRTSNILRWQRFLPATPACSVGEVRCANRCPRRVGVPKHAISLAQRRGDGADPRPEGRGLRAAQRWHALYGQSQGASQATHMATHHVSAWRRCPRPSGHWLHRRASVTSKATQLKWSAPRPRYVRAFPRGTAWPRNAQTRLSWWGAKCPLRDSRTVGQKRKYRQVVCRP